VVNSEEWLVPLPSLAAAAQQQGLELVEARNFHDYFYEKATDPQTLASLQQFHVPSVLHAHEWEVSRNYCVVVLRKRDAAKRSHGS
jgi:hypothetical protein